MMSPTRLFTARTPLLPSCSILARVPGRRHCPAVPDRYRAWAAFHFPLILVAGLALGSGLGLSAEMRAAFPTPPMADPATRGGGMRAAASPADLRPADVPVPGE